MYVIVLKVVAYLASLGIWEIPSNHQVMSGDIDDIQDDRRYRMSRRTYLTQVKPYHKYNVGRFAWAWMTLRGRNPSPTGLATLNPQSTCHGRRRGRKLARGVLAGSLLATEPRAREKTRGRKRKKCRRAQKAHLYIVIYVPIDTWD